MKITDEEYLRQTLRTNQVELKNLEINHRIAIAEYSIKRKMLYDQIDSIEKQLSK